MQFWYVTLHNNKLQFLYLTCLHDSRQLFPLQLRGLFQCCLFWATVKRSQYPILILSLTVTISLKTASSFQNGFSPIFAFSIPSQSCLMFPQTFPSPLHTHYPPFYGPLKTTFASHLSSKIATEQSRAVHSNPLAENSWGYIGQNYEKSQDFPNYHFSLKDTPLSSKYNYIFRKCAKRTEDRYLVVLFAFEIASFQLFTVYVREWESTYTIKWIQNASPKHRSCIKAYYVVIVLIYPLKYASLPDIPVSEKNTVKPALLNTLLKMYLSLLDLLWQQNLGWGTAQRHCTIHSAAIHLTKESRRT